MKAFCVISCWFLGLGITSAQTSYSLEQCIEIAWANNLQVKQSALSLEAAESQMQATRGNVMPNVNGFASHNYNWGQRIDPFTNQFANSRVQSNSFGLSSSVDLFNGFQNSQNIKAQEADMAAARWDVETQKNNIALAVASAFLQVVLTEELIDVAEQQLAITTNQLNRVVKLVEAGSATLGAQYDLEAQAGRDRSNLTQRRNDLQLAFLQLKQLMLVEADQEMALVKPLVSLVDEVSLEKPNTVYAYASTSMPEIKSAEYSLMAREKRLASSKGGYYPSLSLSGSIGTGYSGLRTTVESITFTGQEQIGQTASGEGVFTPTFVPSLAQVPFVTQLNDNFNQFVGLSLTVPIFNRFSVKNAVKQAEVSRSIAALQLEQEKLGLRQRIESASTDASAARELLKANEEAQRSALLAFEFAQKRFEAGAINAMEFNNAKNNLQLAEAQLSLAKYDLVFKSKVLDFYMGKPLGTQGN